MSADHDAHALDGGVIVLVAHRVRQEDRARAVAAAQLLGRAGTLGSTRIGGLCTEANR